MNTVRLTVEDGLPSLEIKDILQTEEGLIWLAHRNGVSYYDGIRFTTYNQKHGFEHPSQSFIELGPDKIIYSLSDDREIYITRLEDGYWENVLKIDTIHSEAKVIGFGVKKADNAYGISIAFATKNHGLYLYDGEWKSYTIDQIGCRFIHDLIVYDHKFLIATDKGILSYEEKEQAWVQIPELPDTTPTYAFYSKGKLLTYVTRNEVVIIDDWHKLNSCKTSQTISWDVRNTPVQILMSPDSIIYVGDETQFYSLSLDNCKITEIDSKTGLTAEGVTSLFCDDTDNVWAASNRGIAIIHQSPFTNYSIRNILPDNEVSAIIEIQPGKFLLGQNTVISVFENHQIEDVVKLSDDKNYNVFYRIQDFTTDGKGKAYFASSKGGFGTYKEGEIEWLTHPEFKNLNYFASVYYDTTMHRLWCAGNNLFGYLDTENRFVHVKTELDHINVRRIVKLSDGNIYAGLNKDGFLKIDSANNVTSYYFNEGSIEDNNIYAMYLDSTGVLWLGTTVGVLYYYQNSYQKSLEGYPLVDAPVYQINNDGHGNIWIGTELSILKFTDQKLVEYTESEGYRGGETNRSAFAVTDEGDILIGGSSGLSIYDHKSRKSKSPSRQARCEITGIHLDTTNYSPYTNNRFAYNQNSFLISFTPISFSGRKNITQQIMLAGLDSDWQTIKDKHTSSAFYSSLRPGTYNFLYRVSNNGGRTWCRAKISGNIVISEPFFTKWWFIGSLFMLFSILIFFVFYLITKNQYSKSLEIKVEKRTRELQTSNNEKDIFFSIIAHDLKSPFNAIIGFSEILKNDYESYNEEEKKLFIDNIYEASKNTYKLIEKLLDWSRAKTGRLQYNPQTIDLSVVGTAMINTYRNTASKKDIIIKSLIGYHSKVFADQNLLETIFRNLISNAIKYTNPGGEIVINAKREEDYVRIDIEDNGIGMEKDELDKLFLIDTKTSTPGTQEESGTGLGLLVVKEFVETNGGTISVSSTPGKGSVFSFTVPAKNQQA